MLLFLRSPRATLVAALAIPSSLAAACAVIRMTGGSLNLMSLGGLAIAVGLVIDDAVVVVEAIHRALAAGLSPRDAAAAGTSELAGPVISSTVTTVVVFAPLGFLSGVVGAFFAALSVALAAAVDPVADHRPHRDSDALGALARPVGGAAARAARRPLRAAVAPRARPPRRRRRRRRRHRRRRARWARCGSRAASSRRWTRGRSSSTSITPIGTSLAEADRLTHQIDVLLEHDDAVETFSRRLGAELGPPAATDAVARRLHRAPQVGQA